MGERPLSLRDPGLLQSRIRITLQPVSNQVYTVQSRAKSSHRTESPITACDSLSTHIPTGIFSPIPLDLGVINLVVTNSPFLYSLLAILRLQQSFSPGYTCASQGQQQNRLQNMNVADGIIHIPVDCGGVAPFRKHNVSPHAPLTYNTQNASSH